MRVAILVNWRDEEIVSATLLGQGELATSFEETVEVAGTEGKVLVDRELLREAIIDLGGEGIKGYYFCRWPDCPYDDAYSDKRAHSGTCPLADPEPVVSAMEPTPEGGS